MAEEVAREDLIRAITDDHLREIGRSIAWRVVGPRLQRISSIDVRDIDMDGFNEADKRRRLLNLWQERNGQDCTYNSMIKAMLSAGENAEADKVSNLLGKSKCTNPNWQEISFQWRIPAQQLAAFLACIGCMLLWNCMVKLFLFWMCRYCFSKSWWTPRTTGYVIRWQCMVYELPVLIWHEGWSIKPETTLQPSRPHTLTCLYDEIRL